MFSTWSPPGYMKTNNDPTCGGYLKPEEYQNFAEFLVAFCKAYAESGLDVNVISPTNEPEFPLVWNSCTWVKGENTLAPFVINNLSPTLLREGLNPKIVLGECAQWGPFLRVFGAIPYLTGVFENYPEIAQLNTIAAGHGYVDPITQDDTEITVIPYTEELGLKSWVTEISREESFSPGIENGVAWAVKFYKYLTQANVSSIIWWAGAQPNYTSETIIGIDDDRVSYTITKRYRTFGHYTRYVKPGSNRVEITLDENIPEEVKVSAFKKENEYVVVAINPTSTEVTFSISLDGTTPTGTLQPILTDETNDWSELAVIPIDEDNSYTVTLPPVSVMTFIGESN
ncbi:MAG: hypothetical protein LUD02_00795 [Tannerellaceae bacterium]|nr:hypothetical protein [Tannerellaceae bacterium]